MATEQGSTAGLSKYANLLGDPSVYLPLIAAILVLVVPLVAAPFYVHVFILMFITGTGAVAWNIIGGFGGQFSLGNAIFFGIGGYSTGILLIEHGINAWVGILVGVILAVVTAIAVGYPAFKLTGHYFALATIAIVEGFWYLAIYFRDLTGGSAGYSIVPDESLATLNFATREPYFYLTYLLFIVAVLVSIWVRNARLGYYLLAIRENQDAAEAVGIDTTRYKVYGFVISAVLTAIAGGLYATYLQFIVPNSMFSLDTSLLYVLIVLIGGIGTIAGPVLGTLLLVPLQTYTTTIIGGEFGALSYVGYGVALVLFIMYAPDGLVDRLSFVGETITEAAPSFDVGTDHE